jgi:3-oxoacyl-[acyl-carrier-protein] synthase III
LPMLSSRSVTNRSLLWPGARTKLPESDVMMKVGFEAIVRFVPEEVIPKEHFDYLKPALAKLPESLREQFSIVPEEVRKYKGGEGDRAELMAIAIAKEALDRAGLRPSDIDYVIGAAVSLHKELGLDLDTPMLNIANCCASFVDSCQIAWNLVKSGACRRVLVVASAALAGLLREPHVRVPVVLRRDGRHLLPLGQGGSKASREPRPR